MKDCKEERGCGAAETCETDTGEAEGNDTVFAFSVLVVIMRSLVVVVNDVDDTVEECGLAVQRSIVLPHRINAKDQHQVVINY